MEEGISSEELSLKRVARYNNTKEMDASSFVKINQISSLKISQGKNQLVSFGGIEGLVNFLVHSSSIVQLDLSRLDLRDERSQVYCSALAAQYSYHYYIRKTS
jgi:hypothetical protein